MGIGGVLISLTLAVDKPLKSVLHGQRDARPTVTFPAGGRRASLPFGRYQIVLLGDRGTRVLTTCPELLPAGALAGSRTQDLSVSSPTR